MIRTKLHTVNFFSFLSNREFRGLSVICILITAQILSGCYSFTGGNDTAAFEDIIDIAGR